MSRVPGGVVIALALLAVLASGDARATWSIVAVDAATREVGIAGASCIGSVEMIAGIAPGYGAVAAQATFHPSTRDEATRMLGAGATPADVLARITSPDFDDAPSVGWISGVAARQYGVVALGPSPSSAAYTGDATVASSLHVTGSDVAVQGNMLADDAVVHDALTAFEAARGCVLVERLVRALEAGARAGGDRRCAPPLAALSAFVVVADPNDAPASPRIRLVVGDELGVWNVVRALGGLLVPVERTGEVPPVQLLRVRLDSWNRDHGDTRQCQSSIPR